MMRSVKPANLAFLIAAAVVAGSLTAIALLATGGRQAEAGTTHTVLVNNNFFQSSSIQIDPGNTVQWLDGQSGGSHTVTQCSGDGTGCPGGSPGFNTAVLTDPSSAYLSQTFPNVGTFFYRCQVHPSSMRGIITVGNPGSATASPTTAPTASPTAMATAAPTATATPTPSPFDRSDVNCDGETDGDDVLALLLHSADAAPAAAPLGNSCAPIGSGNGDGLKGDLNCDGLVNARDALVALYRWAGVAVPGLPEGCPGP